MADIPRQETTLALPPGYRILNDGPGREVLAYDGWDHCPVFTSVAEAVHFAWGLLPVGSRVEWSRGGRMTGYIREIQERGGWPIYSVKSNGRVYRVLPQDCRHAD